MDPAKQCGYDQTLLGFDNDMTLADATLENISPSSGNDQILHSFNSDMTLVSATVENILTKFW